MAEFSICSKFQNGKGEIQLIFTNISRDEIIFKTLDELINTHKNGI